MRPQRRTQLLLPLSYKTSAMLSDVVSIDGVTSSGSICHAFSNFSLPPRHLPQILHQLLILLLLPPRTHTMLRSPRLHHCFFHRQFHHHYGPLAVLLASKTKREGFA